MTDKQIHQDQLLGFAGRVGKESGLRSLDEGLIHTFLVLHFSTLRLVDPHRSSATRIPHPPDVVQDIGRDALSH